jgi:hypothetical protein
MRCPGDDGRVIRMREGRANSPIFPVHTALDHYPFVADHLLLDYTTRRLVSPLLQVATATVAILQRDATSFCGYIRNSVTCQTISGVKHCSISFYTCHNVLLHPRPILHPRPVLQHLRLAILQSRGHAYIYYGQNVPHHPRLEILRVQ